MYVEREFATAAELESIQLQALRKLLIHSAKHVPYYRRLFNEYGFNPDKVDNAKALRDLPLLTKETVRENYEEFMSDDCPQRRSIEQTTSGTLGRPFTVLLDRHTIVHEKIWIHRHRQRFGYQPKEVWKGTLNGQPIIPINKKQSPFWRINHPFRQILFSGYHLSENTIGSYVTKLRSSKIRFMDGYPSILYILASLMNAAGLSAPLEGVFVGAEPLFPFQREAMEKAFQCEVHDYYGLTEKVVSAGDCRDKSGLHVNVEDCVAEIVDVVSGKTIEQVGMEGALVGTSLVNYTMPLVRYVTGDSSAWVANECACGRKLPRLKPIFTKVEDIIMTPSGKWISPSILTYPMKMSRGIIESQVAQTGNDRLEVRVIAAFEFDSAARSELVKGIKQCVGEEMHVEIVDVNEIPRTRSGKFRFVVCEFDHGLRCGEKLQ